MQSDLYTLKEGVISKNPLRESDADPVIELEGMKLKKVLISQNLRRCGYPIDYTCNKSTLWKWQEPLINRGICWVACSEDLLGVSWQLGDFSERIRNTPSILGLDSLRLVGDVWFGKDVVLQVLHPIPIIFKSKIMSSILLKTKAVKSDPNVLFSRARLWCGLSKRRGSWSRMVTQSKTK